MYAAAFILGCGNSVMLVTVLSMTADMIGIDKVREKESPTSFNVVLHDLHSTQRENRGRGFGEESLLDKIVDSVTGFCLNKFLSLFLQASGGFVYSVMGFLDKGFVGAVVLVIQTFYPDSPDGYVHLISSGDQVLIFSDAVKAFLRFFEASN